MNMQIYANKIHGYANKCFSKLDLFSESRLIVKIFPTQKFTSIDKMTQI